MVQSADAAKHCCENMAGFCMTREERLASIAKHSEFYKSAGIDPAELPAPSEPLVDFLEEAGLYCFGSVALHYCPWCGTDLRPRRNLPLLKVTPHPPYTSIVVEMHDGEEGWPKAEALDEVCYPPEVMATVVWRDVTWAHADKRIFIRFDDEIVCHAGLYLRDARDGDRAVKIGGVGGVMTLPSARGRGCASAAMGEAAKLMHKEDCDFGLLFCEPHNIAFYERLGWQVFGGKVICDQPLGRITFDIMQTMVLPLQSAPEASVIDLCGLPW